MSLLKRRSYRYYDLILAFFASGLLLSNLGAVKLIEIGPIILDGGVFLFPLMYIFGDVLTEVYGYKYARRAIWTGFGVMLLAVLSLTLVQYAPPASFWENQAAFEATLGFLPRIVLASLAAYLVGSFVNAYILSRLKVRFAGKKLWLRLIGSTFIGQLLDSTVFALVAFAGILGASEMVIFILVGWLLKTAVEIILLPVTYRIIAFLKKREQVDAYDKKTDFSPLHVAVD